MEVTLNLNTHSVSQKEFNALEGYYIIKGIYYKEEDLTKRIIYSGQPGIWRFYQSLKNEPTMCINAFYFLIDEKIVQLQEFKENIINLLRSD